MNAISEIEDCFSILEIPSSSSIDDVRQARRLLSLVWHPDRFSNNPDLQEHATRKLSDINAAHDRLIDYLRLRDLPDWDEMQYKSAEKFASEKRKTEARRRSDEKSKEEELLRLKTELQIVKMEFDASLRRMEEARSESVKRLEAQWLRRYRRVRFIATVTSILFLISSIGYLFLP